MGQRSGQLSIFIIIKTKGFDMNKSELVEAMAAAADISKAAAERALDGVTAAITGAAQSIGLLKVPYNVVKK